MFDFLKKKITGLVDKIAGKGEAEPGKEIAKEEQKAVSEKIERKEAHEEKKAKPEPIQEKAERKPENKEEIKPPEKKAEAATAPKAAEAKKEAKPAPKTEEKTGEAAPVPKPAKETVAAPKAEAKTEEPRGILDLIKPREGRETKVHPHPVHGEKKPVHIPHAPAEPKVVQPKAAEAKTEAPAQIPKETKPAQQKKHVPAEKKEDKVRLSILTQVKSVFSGEVELSEKDVSSALDDFEMELLEGDVALEVAEQIKGELRRELVGKKVKKSELQAQIASVFLNSIKSIMSENAGTPIVEQVKTISARPVKVMFTGPNGSGKTTTIAKVANLLKQAGFTVVIAAADTFRAAAIEQMEIHGERLGIKVIKGKYGADPTSVAFDAVNHAKAHGIDVVLIDTAGRQETNLNLLNELKKMARVISPEIKVYVAESVAGNSVISQVESFNRELKLDGVILTKLDCDAKGGTVISISKVTHVPVLYVTTGQGYGDIEEFDAGKMAENIAG